jgi:hypothetical protein
MGFMGRKPAWGTIMGKRQVVLREEGTLIE